MNYCCNWIVGAEDYISGQSQPTTFKILCKAFYLGSGYLKFLGFIGALFAILELIEIISNGDELPSCLKRKRIKGNILTSARERDIKLITNVFTICFYLFMTYGCYKNNRWFLYPWFIMQTTMLGGEILIFLTRLYKFNIMNISRQEVICALFSLLNWIQVYCFINQGYQCNYC